MTKLNLSASEKLALEARHKASSNARESDRIKAVLLRSEGWSVKRISQALRLHPMTISQHVTDYQSGKLTSDSGGSNSLLDKGESEALIAHLTEHTYNTSYEISAYIEATYGVLFSIPGLNKWLHRQGFSYKKPKGHPHKADKAQQAAFIEHYSQLKASSNEDEPIVFMDSVHPTQATKITHGWIKRGTDKQIKTSASRTRINLVGGIQLGQLNKAITAQYDTVNSESIINFMQRVRTAYESASTIHLILDGAGYHKAAIVAHKAKQLDITLHFLPPYSPNLNPIERLWKVMNEKVRNNHFFNNPSEFKNAIERFFKCILPDIAPKLDSRINDNFQLLKQAF